MKKIIISISALAIGGFLALNAFSASLTQTGGAGGAVTITVTGTNPAFKAFTPSNNVNMYGMTAPTQFSVGGYHNQVYQKNSGKAFGMSSDSSATYYLDISATGAAVPTVTSSNSSAFTSYTKM